MNNKPTTECRRCGVAARGSKGNPDARIFRRAEQGVCVNCGVVLFLQRLANMNSGSPVHPNPTFGGFPESLRLVHIQECVASFMRAGKSDADSGEIDWEKVIDVWDLVPPPKDTLW